MHSVFTAPDNELTHYDDAIVDYQTSIIADSAGRLVIEQADEALFWLPEAVPHALKKGHSQESELHSRRLWLEKVARRLNDARADVPVLDPAFNYISMLHPFGWYAFGHFFDSVQRLYHALDAVPQPWKVLHSNASSIVDFTTHMRLLGVPEERLVYVNRPMRVPKLWVSPWQTRPADIQPAIYDWIYARYTASLPRTAPQRLYLSRNHVKAGARGVLNEKELVAALKPHGFRVVTGKEPLAQIVSLFHNAEIIIGPHGSLLANCMFAKANCRVLEFCPDNRVERSFQAKRKKMRQYEHVLVPGDAAFNITIPVQKALDFLG